MKKYAHLAGILYSTIFGFSFLFSKEALQIVSPIGLIAYRFLLAFIVFESLRLFKVIKIQYKKEHLKSLLLVAIYQPILYFIFETTGLNISSSSEAGMMIALIPIVVAILSAVLLNERPNKLQLLFIILSVSGVLFINVMKSGSGEAINVPGILLLFGAVVSAAFYNIYSRSASRHLKPYELTYFMMLSGAVVFNLIYIVTLAEEESVTNYITYLSHVELLIPILYLGIIASIGGFFLVNLSLSKLPAHVSSVYANIATIIAILAGYFILNESLYYYHFIGSAMIIIGVYGTNKAKTRST